MDREDYKVLPLAIVGAAEGIARYYIKPEITTERVAFLGGLVIGALVAKSLSPHT